MTKVKYLGGATCQFGYEFEDGKTVDVTDEKHLAKFKGNPFFSVAGDKSEIQKPVTATDALSAKHNGGGRYIIVRGDDTVSTGLTKDDAAAFNALTDDEKAAYVAGSHT